MTTESLYKKADRADEIGDLDITDADPKEVSRVTYDAWREATEGTDDLDALYPQACRITRPYADRLVDIFKERQLPFEITNYEEMLAGFFFSAIINQSSKREIVCNLETESARLAYRLPADKTFINNGEVGAMMGLEAEGIVVNFGKAGGLMGCMAENAVVNYGKTGREMGGHTAGMVINCGRAGELMGFHAKGVIVNYGRATSLMGAHAEGAVINCGEAGRAMGNFAEGVILALKNPKDFNQNPNDFRNLSDAKLVLKEKKCRKIPEIVGYFDGLKALLEEGKKDYHALSKLPNERRIKDDVESILKARGYLK